MNKYLISDMTSKEASEAIKKRKVVILSIGAIHKHGDGPLGTDFFSCQELAKRVGEAIPEKVIVVPTLPFGVFKNVGLPGDIEISFDPVRHIIKDICMSFVRHGISRFLLLNGHGGNNGAYQSVAKELNQIGILFASFSWYNLILQLMHENPNFQNVNVLEQSVNAACGKNDPSLQRDGELRTEVFQERLIKEVLGDKFTLQDNMKGTLVGYGSSPKITSIQDGYVYNNATVQIFLPTAPVDLENPEPGDWPSIADKVSAEHGNTILNTCRDWVIKFLADYEEMEIPEKYITKTSLNKA